MTTPPPQRVFIEGHRVRRPVQPWSASVHALLEHLESTGFPAARSIAINEHGFEALTFVPGRPLSPASTAPEVETDETLVEIARLTRSYHEAVSGFRWTPESIWCAEIPCPDGTDIICHNDIAPWNCILDDHGTFSLIDFDAAAPGTPLWDVANAIWRFVPLSAPTNAQAQGRLVRDVTDTARRLHLFCDEYGVPREDRPWLLELVKIRQQTLYKTLKTRAELGEPRFVADWNAPEPWTHGALFQRDMKFIDAHRQAWLNP